MTCKDLYAVLGIARDADDETLKKAYREAARRFHPDVCQDADAEDRFKEVSQANAVLSDPERRSLYDEFGELALDPNFDAEAAERIREANTGFASSHGFRFEGPGDLGDLGGEAAGSIEDLLSGLFGGSAFGGEMRGSARRGADLHAQLSLDFVTAARGGEQRLVITRPDPSSQEAATAETLTVRVPPGVRDGGRIRLAGKGLPGHEGATSGDLYVQLRVRPHRVFRRKGSDLEFELPVSVAEATLGADVEVPTLDGRAKLRVPAGTDGGTRLRLRGKGVPAHGERAAGDLLVRIRIRVPKDLDEAERATFERLAANQDAELRGDLFD